MLFAARESAVTKNPRLRLMMRRSSSLRPSGSFHVAMSRLMLISCGIQWLAQADRYFSHAHLYLNGTNWLTSVRPLMMRLSSTRMRRSSSALAAGAASRCAHSCRPPALASDAGMKPRTVCRPRPGIGETATSSSKLSMFISPVLSTTYWHASHSAPSIEQNFGSAGSALLPVEGLPPSGTAFNCPVFTVDFSAWVAPIERR